MVISSHHLREIEMPTEAFFALTAMAAFFGTFALVLGGVYWYTRDLRQAFPKA
jgi:hypothetical protein